MSCDESMKKYILWVILSKNIWAKRGGKKGNDQQFAKSKVSHSNPLPSLKYVKSKKSAGKFMWSIDGMTSTQETTQ